MKRFRLATKLAMVIVPIGLVALIAGGLLAQSHFEQAEHEARVSLAARVAEEALDALVAVSAERSALLDAATGDAGVDTDWYRSRTDAALARMKSAVGELLPTTSGSASGVAAGITSHNSLAVARLDRARAGDPLDEDVASLYDEVAIRLIAIVSQSTLYFDDVARAREGAGVVALARASFASSQQEWTLARQLTGAPTDEAVRRLMSLEDTVGQWLSSAADISPTVTALGLARSQAYDPELVVDPETFPYQRNEILADAASEILTRVATAANQAAAASRDRALTVAATVLGMILLGLLVAVLVGRSTVKRVRSVTTAARQVAEQDLPRLVESLSNPKGVVESTPPLTMAHVGSDEVGELARSFGEMHSTLVEVANRQMDILRRGVSDIFVTLARRNRSLVDRQLSVIDDLEAGEENPEILDGYYRLDHLATRMRRNAESLLVLAGSESPRMWGESIDIGEVVRASLGEVDEYQRVDILALEPALIPGRAVSDLAHLLSELVDNATSFSPPHERVRVTGFFDDDGYVISIADSGMGIPPERLTELNELMEDPPVLGLFLEPTLGMYVVARLAARHGLRVKLVAGVPGTTARVTIPRQLIEAGRAVPAPAAVASGAEEPAPVERPEERELPRETLRAPHPPAQPHPVELPVAAPAAGEEVTSLTAAGLPTRNPGEAFTVEAPPVSASSSSPTGPEGIRHALDGFQVGRDGAARAVLAGREPEEGEPAENGDQE